MKIKITLALIALMLAPSLAAARCGGEEHAKMSCADGNIWDTATASCVPVTG